MKKIVILGLSALLAFALLAGYAYNASLSKSGQIKTISLINNKNENIGTIEMTETNAGVLLQLKISGLSPSGTHAFHVHEKGDCSPLESFTNAGGHYNPQSKAHGMMHPDGHHAGDMPNLVTDKNGNISTQILNRSITLEKEQTKDGRATVYDADGSALVIHAKEDDHSSQPSGAAGDRIACGVIY